MQPIERGKFFMGYHTKFGKLKQGQVDGLNQLLQFLEADPLITDIRWAAYMLATVKWETGDTFQPISEYGHGKGRKYGVPDGDTGETYYGRGYVQLTWADGYKAMSPAADVDLYHNPEQALQPEVAYRIMSYGMRHGSFTGVGLSRYIKGSYCDYVNARRIINGTDQAQRIADYAEKFEEILM